MIRANVEGVYVVHAAEEIGCKGSRYINDRFPRWVEELDYCISFDRKGTSSIITHQMGHRTASDDFAHSLAEILGMDLQPDTTGSYTDSNEYAKSVSECTNLSVGYNAQHTNRETQDIAYLELLRDRLISADWSKLRASRDPDNVEFLYQATGKGHWSGLFEGIEHREVLEGKYPIRSWTEALEPDDDLLDMTDLVSEHPRKIAEWLLDQNFTYSELVDFLDLQDAVIPNSHNW
tara:strand:+ start:2561 stop:3262 length:702 start_codon:yes stop_codon:yes gene_type:complete